MKIISVINYKGGVGKTTVTANLAGKLIYKGKKVLLIDLDPQASLTFSFVTPEYWDTHLQKSKSIRNWFTERKVLRASSFKELAITPDKMKKYTGELKLIASHLALINVDLELATQLGGANMHQSKVNYLKVHERLKQGIAEYADEEIDVVLIDCPPNFNIVTKNAIVASDSILIPAKPDYLSTLGIDYLQRSLKELIKEYNEYGSYVKDDEDDFSEINPNILGVVFTMIQFNSGIPISATRPYINQTKKLGISTFTNMFRENKTIFADAPRHGVPVVLENYSNHSHKNVVAEIEKFVREFIKKAGI